MTDYPRAIEFAGGAEDIGPNPRQLRQGSFPTAWGRPPADPEQRTEWIAANIRSDGQRPTRRTPTTGREALAEIKVRGLSRPSDAPAYLLGRRMAESRIAETR